MGTEVLTTANSYASGDRAGGLVVNDHRWDVSIKANGDLIKIGELPAFHRLAPEGCRFYALNKGGTLAAATYDVFIPTADGVAKAAGNTLFDDVAVTANTQQSAAPAAAGFLTAEALGVSSVNRPIYIDAQTAPASAAGVIKVRIASFPDNPTF